MLSSILFQDLGEKAGSIESFKDIQPRNDRIDYSLELGGKVEENVFEVRYVWLLVYCWIMIQNILISHV